MSSFSQQRNKINVYHLITRTFTGHTILIGAVFFILQIIPIYLYAQANFKLTPLVGLQALQCYVLENANADSGFRPNNLATTPSFGLQTQLDIKKNWMFFAGWSTCKFVISYKYNATARNRWVQNSPPFSSVSLGFHKRIAVHQWLRVRGRDRSFEGTKTNGNENLFLLQFRSRIISGVSHNWAYSIPGNTAAGIRNASIFLGLGLQFFNYNKDMLQLNVCYSQGLKEISQAHVEYSFNGKNYSGVLGSKGSFLIAQIAYPIQL
jgi:hypothetical protein